MIETEKITPTTMRLANGETFDLANPDPAKITLELVAQVLARLPRFGGHAGDYTVGQHSLAVARLLEHHEYPPMIVREGLLHDAEEAFVGDVTRPVLEQLARTAYPTTWTLTVKDVRLAVVHALGLDKDTPSAVNVADDAILKAEIAHFWDAGEAAPAAMRAVAWARAFDREQVERMIVAQADSLL